MTSIPGNVTSLYSCSQLFI